MIKSFIFASLIALAYGGPTRNGTDCGTLNTCSSCLEQEDCQWSEDNSICSLYEGENKEHRMKGCFNTESHDTNSSSVSLGKEPMPPVEIEDKEENVTKIVPSSEETTLLPSTGDSEEETTTVSPSSTTPKTTPARPSESSSVTNESPSPITTTPDLTTSTTTTTSTSAPETTTTTMTPLPTQSPSVDPEDKSSFDGWSFFGGILLTLGFFAIGFVGLKYYRVRSRTDADYNRF